MSKQLRPTKRTKIRGRRRPGFYRSEEEARDKIKEISQGSGREFTIQRSMLQKDKWVIIEIWGLNP